MRHYDERERALRIFYGKRNRVNVSSECIHDESYLVELIPCLDKDFRYNCLLKVTQINEKKVEKKHACSEQFGQHYNFVNHFMRG